MSEIRRYDLVGVVDEMFDDLVSAGMEQRPDGEYVKWEDVEKEIKRHLIHCVESLGQDAGPLCDWGMKDLTIDEWKRAVFQAGDDLYRRGIEETEYKFGYKSTNPEEGA